MVQPRDHAGRGRGIAPRTRRARRNRGRVVCDGLLQHRIKPDAATYVGSGKARELAGIVAQDEADTIVVDDDLPPSQRRALEDATKVKVVDRTAVILDIFAQHATSREGKAQAISIFAASRHASSSTMAMPAMFTPISVGDW